MDFSTLEKRQQFCLRELEINRRTAPDLYLDVVPVTRDSARDNRGLHLGETPGGEAVEWVLVMRRFAQEDLLSARAAAGRLTAETAVALADEVARFPEGAEVRGDPAASSEEHTSELQALIRNS